MNQVFLDNGVINLDGYVFVKFIELTHTIEIHHKRGFKISITHKTHDEFDIDKKKIIDKLRYMENNNEI